jgi:hypothetical protein
MFEPELKILSSARNKLEQPDYRIPGSEDLLDLIDNAMSLIEEVISRCPPLTDFSAPNEEDEEDFEL